MKVYVLTSAKVTDGFYFPYEPQVFKTRDGARKMLKAIRDEELIPEYVDIRGYKVVENVPDSFEADFGYQDFVRLTIICTEMK